MLSQVIANLFSRPATRKGPVPGAVGADGYRGAVVFGRDGCNYCGACASRCPTLAIVVDRAAQTVDFDLFKCIGCACCSDACKKGCVQLVPSYAAPTDHRPATLMHTGTAAEHVSEV